MPDAAPDTSAPTASAPSGDGSSGSAPDAPSPVQSQPSVHLIVPGPYTAPISTRAAARFAQQAGAPPGVPASLAALGRQDRGTRLTVLVLVGAALVAAGGVGTALAFRFGGARAHGGNTTPTPAVSAPAVPPRSSESADDTRP